MLNRRTIPATQIRRDNYNNFVYLPLITVSDRSSSSLVPSSSSFDNNTDAILFEKHNNHLDSQTKQRVPASRQLGAGKSSRRITQAYFHLKFCQSPKFNPTEANLTTVKRQRKQPVNSKTNKIENIHCFKNKSRSSPRLTVRSKMTNHIYYLTALLLALCALSMAPVSVQADRALTSALERFKVPADIIPSPDDLTTIKLELHGNNAKPGDAIPAKNFKDLDILKIHWDGSSADDRHTVMLLDLDRRPGINGTLNVYNQYTSTNILGTKLGAGQAIVAFEPPIVPCHPSVKHRILLLAFRQEQNIDLRDLLYMSAATGHSSSRENFSVSDFIKRTRAYLIAANILQAVGESNGVCSGSVTLHLVPNISFILLAMVTLSTALGLSSRR